MAAAHRLQLSTIDLCGTQGLGEDDAYLTLHVLFYVSARPRPFKAAVALCYLVGRQLTRAGVLLLQGRGAPWIHTDEGPDDMPGGPGGSCLQNTTAEWEGAAAAAAAESCTPRSFANSASPPTVPWSRFKVTAFDDQLCDWLS